jgi:His-Xaa-Ser system protein HxsD
MAVPENPKGAVSHHEVSVPFDLTFVSSEALLKACHWFSRDFRCDLQKKGDSTAEVVLSPRDPATPFDPDTTRDAFTASAIDFALREKIEVKTSGIRDLLLAKAFSESGVLEDRPEGVFGDAIEEAKPDGIFKILSGPQA